MSKNAIFLSHLWPPYQSNLLTTSEPPSAPTGASPLSPRRTSAHFAEVRRGGGGGATVRAKRSPGEGKAERRKLPNRTQWVNWNPTRRDWPNPGSGFCVVASNGGTKRKQPVLRPGDRALKCTGSPRPSRYRSGGQHQGAVKARHRGSTGVPEQGKGTLGFSGNLGEPQDPCGPKTGNGVRPVNNPLARRLRTSRPA